VGQDSQDISMVKLHPYNAPQGKLAESCLKRL
jgi:hypothetical protein